MSKVKNVLLIKTLGKIKNFSDERGVSFWLLGGMANAFQTGELYREFGDLDLIVKTPEDYKVFLDILDDLGFLKIREKQLSENLVNSILRNDDGIEVDIGPYNREFGLKDSDFEEEERELEGVSCKVISKRFLSSFKKYSISSRDEDKDLIDLKLLEEIDE